MTGAGPDPDDGPEAIEAEWFDPDPEVHHEVMLFRDCLGLLCRWLLEQAPHVRGCPANRRGHGCLCDRDNAKTIARHVLEIVMPDRNHNHKDKDGCEITRSRSGDATSPEESATPNTRRSRTGSRSSSPPEDATEKIAPTSA